MSAPIESRPTLSDRAQLALAVARDGDDLPMRMLAQELGFISQYGTAGHSTRYDPLTEVCASSDPQFRANAIVAQLALVIWEFESRGTALPTNDGSFRRYLSRAIARSLIGEKRCAAKSGRTPGRFSKSEQNRPASLRREHHAIGGPSGVDQVEREADRRTALVDLLFDWLVAAVEKIKPQSVEVKEVGELLDSGIRAAYRRAALKQPVMTAELDAILVEGSMTLADILAACLTLHLTDSSFSANEITSLWEIKEGSSTWAMEGARLGTTGEAFRKKYARSNFPGGPKLKNRGTSSRVRAR